MLKSIVGLPTSRRIKEITGATILLIATSIPALAFQPAGNTRETVKTTHFIVSTRQPQQTVEHFGASDAWSMKTIGLWPEKEQRKIADWLFSLKTDASGSPLGIGLSLWRFNLGAGSEEQGESSQINSGTRTQCLLRPDGTYDWTRQKGERNFLKLAKKRKVPYFLAFLNSAPVQFTQNGLATNTGRGGTINLRSDCYDDFARFMATALKGIEEHDSIHFSYLSPVNEPDGHWNWLGPKQEGSPATNREIARLVRETDKQLRKQHLTTQIIIPESSDLRCLLDVHQTSWERGYTIRTLFSKDSTSTWLGNVQTLAPVIAGHSYWTNTPLKYMRDIRVALRDTLKKYGRGFWQTETCIMSNDEEIGGGGGYDFSMKTALYVARIIHHDLVFANAQSWSWWRAIGGDYRDGLLRGYWSKDGNTGWVADSKLLWTLGNYSRFIRPEAVRYDMTATDEMGKNVAEGFNDVHGVMCSAYRNKDNSWVVVAINYSDNFKPFILSTDDGQGHEWQIFRTSEVSTENLKHVGQTDGRTTLVPRSVTTFVAR